MGLVCLKNRDVHFGGNGMDQEYAKYISMLVVLLTLVAVNIYTYLRNRVKDDPNLEDEILSVFIPGLEISDRGVVAQLKELNMGELDLELVIAQKYLAKLVRGGKLECVGRNNILLENEMFQCKIYALPGYKNVPVKRKSVR